MEHKIGENRRALPFIRRSHRCHTRKTAGMLGRACAIFSLSAVTLAQTPKSESAFLRETDLAMNRMMAGMTVKGAGTVDQDFVAMMVPHHQGAIDMAIAELRYGHDSQLKRIAQEIIIDQQQEIAAMRLALGQPLPPPAPAPTGAGSIMPASHSHGMEGQ